MKVRDYLTNEDIEYLIKHGIEVPEIINNEEELGKFFLDIALSDMSIEKIEEITDKLNKN